MYDNSSINKDRIGEYLLYNFGQDMIRNGGSDAPNPDSVDSDAPKPHSQWWLPITEV